MLKDKLEKYTNRGEAPPPDLLAQIATASGFGPSPAAAVPFSGDHKDAMARALTSISAFKTANAGGLAAATLKTLVKNALEKGGEDAKFRCVVVVF